MNQHPQRQPAPAQISVASTAPQARKLAENLMDVMSALLGVIERETELVRAGKLREALAFEPQKTDLSRRYVNAVAQLKASQKYLAQTAPELPALTLREFVLEPGLRLLAEEGWAPRDEAALEQRLRAAVRALTNGGKR